MPEMGRISALYATTNNTLPNMVILKLKLWHWKDLTQRYKEVYLPTVSSDAKAMQGSQPTRVSLLLALKLKRMAIGLAWRSVFSENVF